MENLTDHSASLTREDQVYSYSNMPLTPARAPTVRQNLRKLKRLQRVRRNLITQFQQEADYARRQRTHQYTTEMRQWQAAEVQFQQRVSQHRPALKEICGEQNISHRSATCSRLNWQQGIPLTEEQQGKGISDKHFIAHLLHQCRRQAYAHRLSKGKENHLIPGNLVRATAIKHSVYTPLRNRYLTRTITPSLHILTCVHELSEKVKVLCKYTENNTPTLLYLNQLDATEESFNALEQSCPI